MRLLASLGLIICTLTMSAEELAIAENATAAEPLAVGATIPDAPLTALDGSITSMHTVLDGPALVIVFRGGWCPYCTTQLAELRTIEADLSDLGVDIIGISPDSTQSLGKARDEKDLGYALYSDHQMALISGLGLAFAVDDETVVHYQGYGIPLVNAPGTATPVLPVPAVYVVDGDGQVVWRHYDADYRKRPAAAEVLAAARTALAE